MEKLATVFLIAVCCAYVEGATTASATTIATTAAATNAATTTEVGTTMVTEVTTVEEATTQQMTTTVAEETTAAGATTPDITAAGGSVSAYNTTDAADANTTAATETPTEGATTTDATTAQQSTSAAETTTTAATTTEETTVMATTTPLITTTELDPCLSDPCQNGGNCSRGSGGYMCSCTGTGYMGVNCAEDVNECQTGAHMCDDDATCTNTEGVYNCTCNDGYQGDGMNCTDIDECTEGNDNCHAQATCNNMPGSYECVCKEGQKGNGTYCEDVDECEFGIDTCDEHATCNNTEGNYTCTCNAGYTGDGWSCTDIDECNGTHSCHDNSYCVNTEGSYTCHCKEGYTNNGTACVDIDECFLGSDMCQFLCDNTDGSFMCGCPDDYILQNNNKTCALNATCDVTCTTPAYCVLGENDTCACPLGYMLESGVNCEDLNECLNDTDNNCDLDNGGSCVNTEGGYACECEDGYSLLADGITCQDIDECEDMCKNGDCANTPGGYNCTCNPGYMMNTATHNCEDVNECEEQAIDCGENQKCENEVGNYTCKCLQGFFMENGKCYKATQAFAGQIEFQGTYTDDLANPGTLAFRTKALEVEIELFDFFSGKYSTFQGAKVTGFRSGSIIADYDLLFATPPGQESTLTSAALSTELRNELQQSCVTVNNEKICELPGLKGVVLSGTRVEDLNECASTSSYQCPANTDCVNIDGGYRCECQDGYQADPDLEVEGKQFCTELDACAANPCPDNQYCYLRNDRTHECRACPCLNGGTCVTIRRNDNYYYSCRCPGGYSGEDCGSQTAFFIATIACAAGAGLFLIILVIVGVCHCCRRKDKSQSNGALHHGVEAYGDAGWRPGKLRANFDPDKHMEMQETEPKKRMSGDQASGPSTTFGSGHTNQAATGDDGKQLDMDYF